MSSPEVEVEKSNEANLKDVSDDCIVLFQFRILFYETEELCNVSIVK